MLPTVASAKSETNQEQSPGIGYERLTTSQKKQLTRAVLESITYATGEAPRRRTSIIPQIAGWIAFSLFVLFVILLFTKR